MKIQFTLSAMALLAGSLVVPGPVKADENPSTEGDKQETISAKALLEQGRTSGSWPEGMIIRVNACLGEPDKRGSGDGVPNEVKETWEFTSGQVRRIQHEDDGADKITARPFDSKGICTVLLEGKAIEIQARKGKGSEVGFIGSRYHLGSRSIEVLRKGDTILSLVETNGPFLRFYRESDARAFSALFEKLASQARVLFEPKAADAGDRSNTDSIAWGAAVNGLQLGISPTAGTKGVPMALFDGGTLRVNVQVRNAGKSPVSFIPSSFGCAAMGPGGAIPVTKLILTPSEGGEPLSITYQGLNHVSDQKQLDADDVEYFATVLAPGELGIPYPAEYTPGKDRATSWQRTGGSNLVPAGKYRVKAVFVSDRKESQWKGELTSGSLEVEIPSLTKK